MVRASSDLSPTSGTDADWYFGTGGLFWHAGRSRNSEILRSHRSWGRLFWEYLRKLMGFNDSGTDLKVFPQVRCSGSY